MKKLWLSIAFFVASFAVLTYGQTINVISTGPKLTPAQAAEILRGAAMQSNMANRPTPLPAALPSLVILGVPGGNTWMPMPKTSETRRLDGTSINTPPANYGGQSATVVIVAPEK